MIIDSSVFPLDVLHIEKLNRTSISEDTETILTADSTEITVVTGYTQYYRRIVKLRYELNQEIVERIEDSYEVNLRYYVGPRMITIKLGRKNLKMLKKLMYME